MKDDQIYSITYLDNNNLPQIVFMKFTADVELLHFGDNCVEIFPWF